MGGAVFLPCSLFWGQTAVEVMAVMVLSFKRACVRIVFTVPDPMAATVDPCFSQRVLDTHRQIWLSLLWGHWAFLLGPGVHKVLLEPSYLLWHVCGLILNMISPLLLSCCGFSFSLGCVVSFFFLVGSSILLWMVVQQLVAILEFSWEKMSTHSSTLPSAVWLGKHKPWSKVKIRKWPRNTLTWENASEMSACDLGAERKSSAGVKWE